MNIFFSLLLVFIAPIVLLPIERILPYPHVIEEFVKLIAVFLIIVYGNKHKKNYWIFSLFVGFLFSISESMLYLINIFEIGNFLILPQRLFLTGIIHSMTSVLMYLLGKKSLWLLAVGFTLSVFIHYYYNLNTVKIWPL